ncbi:hypothetical protein ACIQ6R_19130 [Streptomyces sp. NPDC096048]|uniref:hypothetical protein n=1 Tax=Streptomyces sp. NPDC096048 TaxID=3366072 RepID=UPI003816A9C1
METLALAAGTALIAAMATDGWNTVRSGAVALWRKVHPERVPAIEADLAAARTELMAAPHSETTEAELVAEWRRRLARLLNEEPGLADELQKLLDERWRPLLSENDRVRVQRITMTADVRDEGRAYQAARDQHFHRD